MEFFFRKNGNPSIYEQTLEFLFWGLNICVDFDLRDSKKMELAEFDLQQMREIIIENKMKIIQNKKKYLL